MENPYSIFDTIKDFSSENSSDLVALPHYYGKVIDNFSKFPPDQAFSQNTDNITKILGLWGTCQVFSYMNDKLDSIFIPKLTNYFRTHITEKVLFYYEKKADDPKVGEILSKIIRLPAVIRDIFAQLRLSILPSIMINIFAMFYMFSVDNVLGVLMFLGFLMFYMIVEKFVHDSMDEIEKSLDEFDNVHEEIMDVLSNTTSVYSNNKVQHELNNLSDSQESYAKKLSENIMFVAKFKTLFNATYLAVFSAVTGYAMKLFSEKKIGIDASTSVLIILLFCITGLRDVSNDIRDFVFNIAGLISLQRYLDEIRVKNSATEGCGDLKSDIVFRGVNISRGDNELFSDLNFVIPANKITIIRGKVGAGKSTIIKSILKIHPISSGKIFIGGVDSKNLTSNCIRNKISYVPQHPNLFNRSVYDNVNYGSDLTEQEIQYIIDQFQIHELDGVELGRSAGKLGCNLSGGQRQLILILRELLRDKSIILLDEPTSSLSENSKNVVLSALKSSGKTVVIITHDDDVEKFADNVIRV